MVFQVILAWHRFNTPFEGGNSSSPDKSSAAPQMTHYLAGTPDVFSRTQLPRSLVAYHVDSRRRSKFWVLRILVAPTIRSTTCPGKFFVPTSHSLPPHLASSPQGSREIVLFFIWEWSTSAAEEGSLRSIKLGFLVKTRLNLF